MAVKPASAAFLIGHSRLQYRSHRFKLSALGQIYSVGRRSQGRGLGCLAEMKRTKKEKNGIAAES
jgi:hypothetical protein